MVSQCGARILYFNHHIKPHSATKYFKMLQNVIESCGNFFLSTILKHLAPIELKVGTYFFYKSPHKATFNHKKSETKLKLFRDQGYSRVLHLCQKMEIYGISPLSVVACRDHD